MKKNTVRIYALSICAIFLVAVLFFVLGIFFESQKVKKSVQNEFDSLCEYTKNLSAFYEPENSNFLEFFKKRADSSNKFLEISLIFNGTILYEKHSQGEDLFFAKMDFVCDVSNQIGLSLILQCKAALVSSYEIFSVAKISFFMILLGTIFAFVLLALQTISMKNESEKPKNIFEDLDLEAEDDSKSEKVDSKSEDFFESENEKVESESERDDSESEKVESKNEEKTNDEDFKDENFENEKSQEVKTEEKLENFVENEESQNLENSNEFQNSGKKLAEIDTKIDFNNATNEEDEKIVPLSSEEESIFNDESEKNESPKIKSEKNDFEITLEDALEKSVANENDLSLVIVKAAENSLEAKRLFSIAAKSLEEKNAQKISVFEIENGIAIIFRDTDLDQALPVGEELSAKLKTLFEDNGIECALSTGIAARTERMINAERLSLEAEQACIHGFEDPSSAVVAFRVDPEKYRKYLAGLAEE